MKFLNFMYCYFSVGFNHLSVCVVQLLLITECKLLIVYEELTSPYKHINGFLISKKKCGEFPDFY
jgi:hypothetical protein